MTDTATPGALDLVELRELADDLRRVPPLYMPDHVILDQAAAAVMALCDKVERLRAALQWAMTPNPRYEGRHRTEPRCAEFMPTDAKCNCGYDEARAALATPTGRVSGRVSAEPAVPVETEARDE